MGKLLKFVLVMGGAVSLAGLTVSATAQIGVHTTPCGIALQGSAHGLTPVNGGTLVYDENQELCWLGDANLAGNPRRARR